MDAPLLVNGEGAKLLAEDGDYVPARNFKTVKDVFWIETKRMWVIALPIVFNIWCQFGVNSVTSIFVGHLGDIELSAISLINSVIGSFAFGFMVSHISSLQHPNYIIFSIYVRQRVLLFTSIEIVVKFQKKIMPVSVFFCLVRAGETRHFF